MGILAFEVIFLNKDIFLQQQASAYVDHYREVIVSRLKKELVDFHSFLVEVCDFRKHFYAIFLDHLEDIKTYYQFNDLGLTGEEYDKALQRLWLRFRGDVYPLVLKEIQTCMPDEISSLEKLADYIEKGLQDYVLEDPEDEKLYREDIEEIAQLRRYANNLRQLSSALEKALDAASKHPWVTLSRKP